VFSSSIDDYFFVIALFLSPVLLTPKKTVQPPIHCLKNNEQKITICDRRLKDHTKKVGRCDGGLLALMPRYKRFHIV